jgi:hypothetical protein
MSVKPEEAQTIRSRIADLGERGDVNGVVEFPIASTREPVSDATS